MADRIEQNVAHDGIDRRGFLKCMAWVGTGVLWTVRGGILTSRAFGAGAAADAKGDFSFAQISDSHIGFSKEPNKDVAATLQLAIDRINAMPARPELLIHTGDLTHLSKPAEFDVVAQSVKGAKVGNSFYVPGEHDIFTDDGKSYLDRYGKGTRGQGWHSNDYKGVHFIGLVNVANLKPGGLGVLGQEQLDWLKKDVKNLKPDTPVVVFTHSPLWDYYPRWNFQTEDAPEIRNILSKFERVMAFHGHVHQTVYNKIGNLGSVGTLSTSWPWPYPDVDNKYPGMRMNRVDPGNFEDGNGSQFIDLEGNFEGTMHYKTWANMMPATMKNGFKI